MASAEDIALYGQNPETITNELIATFGYLDESEPVPPATNRLTGPFLLLPEQYKHLHTGR